MDQQRKNSMRTDDRDLSPNSQRGPHWIEADREWPVLPQRQPPNRPTGPTIPRGIFPTWVDDWADAWAGSFQADRSLLLGNVLGAAATLAQGRVWIYAKAGEWQEGPNVYLAVVANSGSLKSPAFERAFKPVNIFEDEIQEAAKPRIQDAEIAREALSREIERKKHLVRTSKPQDAAKRSEIEAEIAADKKALDALPVVVMPRLLLPTNMTPETVVRHLARQGGFLTIASGEDSFMPIVSGRYSNDPAIESFLDCYSNKGTGSHRVDDERSFDVPGPTALSIVTSTQPSALRDFFGDERSKGRGLHARFLFLVLRTPPGTDFTLNTPAVPQKVDSAYQNRMLALGRSLWARSGQDEALSILLSREAREVFEAVYSSLRAYSAADATSTEDAAFAAKAGGTILRLAALLYLLDEGPIDARVASVTVSGAVMDRAIRLFRIFGQHYEVAQNVAADADGASQVSYAERVLEWAADSKREGSFTRGDFGQRFRGEKRKSAGEALEELVRLGLVRESKRATTGRAATVYEVHPDAAAYLAGSVSCPWSEPPAGDADKHGSPQTERESPNFRSELPCTPSVHPTQESTEAPPFRASVQKGGIDDARKSPLENKADSPFRPPSVLPCAPGGGSAVEAETQRRPLRLAVTDFEGL